MRKWYNPRITSMYWIKRILIVIQVGLGWSNKKRMEFSGYPGMMWDDPSITFMKSNRIQKDFNKCSVRAWDNPTESIYKIRHDRKDFSEYKKDNIEETEWNTTYLNGFWTNRLVVSFQQRHLSILGIESEPETKSIILLQYKSFLCLLFESSVNRT